MGNKYVKPQAQVAIRCDGRTSRKLKDNSSPVRLRIRHEGKEKFYGIDISMDPDDFAYIHKGIPVRMKEERKLYLEEMKEKIERFRTEAKSIISNINDFTFEQFESLMFPKKETNYLFEAMEARIKELEEEGRIGNASTYRCALNNLRLFRGGKRVVTGRKVVISGGEDLKFNEVTIQFLKSYEKWFLSKGNSITTLGIYLRNVQYLIYKAAREEIIPLKSVPFGRDKYIVPTGPGRKLALHITEIRKIIHAELPEGSRLEMLRDYWVFSYLCNGINIADMAKLKYKNIINGEVIEFQRQKTALKKRGSSNKSITATLLPEIGRIIDKWGVHPRYPDNYIFPILHDGITPKETRAKVVNITSAINKAIKHIALVMGINEETASKISTYTARHSHATIRKRNGDSVESISDDLGHSDTRITQAYLDSFDLEQKRISANKLL